MSMNTKVCLEFHEFMVVAKLGQYLKYIHQNLMVPIYFRDQ